MKKLALILLLLVVIITSGCLRPALEPTRIENQSISGIILFPHVLAGEILVTGDVIFTGDLVVEPGTVIKFAVQDDQNFGFEIRADGYNDLDPTRLKSYDKGHANMMTLGKLFVNGTPENPVIFTSAAENPQIADWVGITPDEDGTIIQHAIVEWSREGIAPNADQPNTIIRNCKINHTMWGPISLGWSSAQAYNNVIQDCGHEGIDVQDGTPFIENNTIYDCHVGIVVLRGSATVRNNRIINSGGGPNDDGIHIGGDATPVLENNYFEPYQEGFSIEWRYGDFAYTMFGEPEGTPLLTEVYSSGGEPRYATPGYRLEIEDYVVELPMEADEWLFYGWKDDGWQQIEAEITGGECKLPPGYSTYVFIPNPTDSEKNTKLFNKLHSDIYKIMAV